MKAYKLATLLITLSLASTAWPIEVGEAIKTFPLKTNIDSWEVSQINLGYALSGAINKITVKKCVTCAAVSFSASDSTVFRLEKQVITRDKAALLNNRDGVISFKPGTNEALRVIFFEEARQ